MTTVSRWTGREAGLLRTALRMTLCEFAHYLGISDRTISKWEAGGAGVVPRPHSQALLDTALARASPEARRIFEHTLTAPLRPQVPSPRRSGAIAVESHKFIPVFIGTDAAAALTAAYPASVPRPTLWLQHVHTLLDHPQARSCTLYVFSCGVALFHLVQDRTPRDLTELALWRYRTYAHDLPWAEQTLHQALHHASPDPPPAAEYVLSLYRLHHGPWEGERLDTALRLMSTPSVLVDRQSPGGPHPADPSVEKDLLDRGFDHQDIVSFGVPNVALGHASWSGVAYHAHAPERALMIDELLTCELTVQALWCFCRRVEAMIEQGQDPVMPEPYGWRFLRAAHSRLVTARAQETAQYRLMREAVMATSGLTERLRAAQEALRDTHTDTVERQ
ncbi:DNA-binding transcriptional regulator [Nocardiopsis sp. CNS-639]|uniref:helix-turn-helix domain-containing protein n=1 Tax=Nocardiopsis sp. CNS-639 TaxID=1169153 RepID=UPI00035E1AB5|nr:transcriptional regulator [Nocardiopsis sp. CNS-639]